MAEHNETVTILTYKRNSKAWLCNECETENHMEYTKCIVCGMNRQVTSRVLETWETARTKPKTTSTPTISTPTTPATGWVNTTAPVSKPTTPTYYPPASSGGDSTGIKAIICVVIAIIVIIGLVVFLNENFYLF